VSQGIDPRTAEPVGDPIPDHTADDVNACVDRAAEVAGWLAATSNSTRAAMLRAVASAIRDNETDLVALADAETALGEQRLVGELARTAAQLDLFAGVIEEGAFCEATIDHANPAAVPPHGDLRRMLVPLGPVAVFAASNFPFAFSVLGGDTASALAAGCPVVVKAHPSHPGLSNRVAKVAREALAQAGAPTDLLQVVHGYEAGRILVTHPAITAVGFTGSVKGGRALFDLASGREDPIPFYGELGSINPVVITEAALAQRSDQIAAGLVGSFTLGTGQFCTKPGLIFAPDDQAFAEAVAEKAQAVDLGPMLDAKIHSAYQEGVEALCKVPGVAPVLTPEAASGPGYHARPAVLTVSAKDFRANARALTEECFGPVTVIVSYQDTAELAGALSEIAGSLTGTIHAEPGDPAAAEVLDVLRKRAGRIIFNGWPTGVAVTWSQHHGGPWPATTSVLHTSVGATAIRRWLRPVTYQDAPDELLPQELQEANPLGIPRRVDGVLQPGSPQR